MNDERTYRRPREPMDSLRTFRRSERIPEEPSEGYSPFLCKHLLGYSDLDVGMPLDVEYDIGFHYDDYFAMEEQFVKRKIMSSNVATYLAVFHPPQVFDGRRETQESDVSVHSQQRFITGGMVWQLLQDHSAAASDTAGPSMNLKYGNGSSCCRLQTIRYARDAMMVETIGHVLQRRRGVCSFSHIRRRARNGEDSHDYLGDRVPDTMSIWYSHSQMIGIG